MGDVGKGQECTCRSHRRAEWGRTRGTQLGRGPCPVHQQRREAPGGDSREGAHWVCPWCGGATGKAPTMGQGPTGSKSRGFPCFHDFYSISGPTLCGSPNSPQTWLRPPVLPPMTGKQLIKEGLLAGPPGSASPWASRPCGGRVAVGPRNASGVSTRRHCHGRITPFLCSSLLEGWGQAQGGPGFLWPSCCLREVRSQKSMVQEPQGCCNSGNISLEAGGARRARAQCAAGTGGWSLGWDAPPHPFRGLSGKEDGLFVEVKLCSLGGSTRRSSCSLSPESPRSLSKQRPRGTSQAVQWFRCHTPSEGFSGGASGKESTCQGKRCKRHGFDPWFRKIPLEEEMARISGNSYLKIPWTEEPGRQQSMGSQKVRYD